MRRALLPAIVLIGAGLALSACVNTRVYSEQELSVVARTCGIAQGLVVQEPDYPRILFLLAVEPSLRQLRCVRQWSRRRNMHLSRIDGIDWPAE